MSQTTNVLNSMIQITDKEIFQCFIFKDKFDYNNDGSIKGYKTSVTNEQIDTIKKQINRSVELCLIPSNIKDKIANMSNPTIKITDKEIFQCFTFKDKFDYNSDGSIKRYKTNVTNEQVYTIKKQINKSVELDLIPLNIKDKIANM